MIYKIAYITIFFYRRILSLELEGSRRIIRFNCFRNVINKILCFSKSKMSYIKTIQSQSKKIGIKICTIIMRKKNIKSHDLNYDTINVSTYINIYLN